MIWFRRRDSKTNPAGASPPSSPATGASHRIDVTAAGIRIDHTLLEALTVSALTALLGAPRVVPPEDPAPDERGLVRSTLVIWDDAGVRAYTRGGDEVSELSIRLAEDPAWDRSTSRDVREGHPRRVFTGTFTVGGQNPLETIPEAELRKAYIFLETKVGPWESTFSLHETACGALRSMVFAERFAKSNTDELANIVRAAAHPFREVAISHLAPKRVKKPSGKWQVPTATEPVLEIASFPFRLAIVQHLMFDQALLVPCFDVHDFAQDQGARSFDPDEIGYEVIPAVRDWFARLPIPARLAAHVETLVLDGGNDIYLQLIPQWDGEDDAFAITSLTAADLAPFTRLRRVDDIGGFLGPGARTALIARGVTVT